MSDVVEIAASDLCWILADGQKTFTTTDGIPEGASVIDAWQFDGIVYFRLDRHLDE